MINIDRDTDRPDNEDDGTTPIEPVDTSVRGSIRAAIEEVEDVELDDEPPVEAKEPKEAKEPTEKPAGKPSKDELSRRLEKAREAKARNAQERKNAALSTAGGLPPPVAEKPDSTKQTPQDTTKREAPPFWKSKAADVWNGLNVAQQDAIIKREQEVSQGFQQYGLKSRAFDELYRVIEPQIPSIQRFGVTIPQTIERLFGWMNALAQPDEARRADAFKALAQSFNVNLGRLGVQQGQQEGQDNVTNGPPEWFQQYSSSVEQRLNATQQTQQQQLQQQQAQIAQSASTYLQNWAKDKPYYDEVRHQMRYLFDNNLVELLPDGSLDLNRAYEIATNQNPNVQTRMRADAQAKAQADAQAKAQAKAAEGAKRLANARRAGSSLRPAAPTLAIAATSGKPNGASSGKGKSVRDSLKESIAEIAEA